MGRKYIKDLPSILSPSFDGYFIYDDGTTTYKGTINGLYDKFSPYYDSRYVNVTGDTMTGKLTLNDELNLQGNVRLYGAEPGLILRKGDNSDFADITAKKFIKYLGTGDQYLMANGTVTTTGDTISLFNGAYVNITGDTMTGELTINNNLNINGGLIQSGETYITGIVNIEGNLAVFGDIGDDIDKVYRGYFNNLYGNFISGKTIYSSGDLNVEDNVRISGYTDMFDTLAIHNADLLIGGYLGWETKPVPIGYFNEIIAFSGITGETIYSNSNINLNGYVSLYGTEPGLILRKGDNSDFGDITAKKFITYLGTGDQYLMANGSVTTSGATTSYYDSRYVNVNGDTMSGELTINNNLNLNGDAYVTGIVNIEGNLAVFGDIGDDIDKVYRGYFNNLYGNFISGETIYSSGDLNVEDNVRISGYTDMFDTLAIHNADLLIGGYLGYETEPVSFGYFNEIIALSGITGETIYSNSNININGLLGLSGYVKLQGDESGLMIRDNDGTDWRDISARSIIKHLGTGAEYLMADGSVTTSGATTSYYDSRYVNVSGDTIINPVNTPSTSSSPGVSGQISWDTNNLYLCVGVNTWKKISLETF